MTAVSALTPRNAGSRMGGGMGRSIGVAVTPSNNGNAASTLRRPATAVPTWRDRAACHNRPAQWWDDDAPAEQQQKAREACLGCPVLAQCLADASESDGGYDYGRTNIKAALTGQQRDWLYRYSRKHGPYDAEEARLIALEAKVSSRPVKEIAAREGVEGVTARLAGRMLMGLVEDPAVSGRDPKATVGACDRALQRIDEILVWRDERVTLDEIARRVGVSRTSIKNALKKYWAQPEMRANGRFTDEEIPELVTLRQRGVTWTQMDAEAGAAEGTTYQRMCRWRRDAEQRGVPIPRELAREIHKLTQAQVVRVRERAQEGVTDAVQAKELGVSRQQVTRIVSGQCYRHYGGPIRAAKELSRQPSLTSRVLFNGGSASFAKAS